MKTLKSKILMVMCDLIPVRRWRKFIRRRLIPKGVVLPQRSKYTRLQQEILRISRAVSDPNGMGMLSLMMRTAYVMPDYKFIFQGMRKGDICIDCGVNIGIVSDMMLHMGASVYGFEPHPKLYHFLQNKYEGNDAIDIRQQAVWHKAGKMKFHMDQQENSGFLEFSQGAHLVLPERQEDCSLAFEEVEVIDLVEFIQAEIIAHQKEVYLLKIDIEGAEFELIEKLIETKAYQNIRHIVCETHERFMDGGEEKLNKIKSLIRDHQIVNIHLDWI